MKKIEQSMGPQYIDLLIYGKNHKLFLEWKTQKVKFGGERNLMFWPHNCYYWQYSGYMIGVHDLCSFLIA